MGLDSLNPPPSASPLWEAFQASRWGSRAAAAGSGFPYRTHFTREYFVHFSLAYKTTSGPTWGLHFGACESTRSCRGVRASLAGMGGAEQLLCLSRTDVGIAISVQTTGPCFSRRCSNPRVDSSGVLCPQGNFVPKLHGCPAPLTTRPNGSSRWTFTSSFHQAWPKRLSSPPVPATGPSCQLLPGNRTETLCHFLEEQVGSLVLNDGVT